MPSPFPPRCAAKFQSQRELASGGFGSVHLATQSGLGRRVVVKLLHAGGTADAEQVARFVNEARITARLSHPHIVVVIDHDVENGVPWIAYEYVEGQDLRALLDSGPLPFADAASAAAQIAAALAAAHRAGVLHRDIKPENVLQSRPGEFKVTDFGIAKWQEGGVRTAEGLILGTPAYLAPEVIAGERAGPAADLYALGVVLYEMLAGRRPFVDDNPMALLEQHVKAEVPPLARFREGVPPALAALTLRVLAKNPGARPASARELEAALRAYLGGPDTGRTQEVRTTSRRASRGVTAPLSRGPSSAPPRARSAWLAGALVAIALGAGAWRRSRPVEIPPPPAIPSPRASPTRPRAGDEERARAEAVILLQRARAQSGVGQDAVELPRPLKDGVADLVKDAQKAYVTALASAKASGESPAGRRELRDALRAAIVLLDGPPGPLSTLPRLIDPELDQPDLRLMFAQELAASPWQYPAGSGWRSKLRAARENCRAAAGIPEAAVLAARLGAQLEADGLTALGEGALGQRRWADAASLAARALALDPQFDRYWLRARAQYESGDLDRAIENMQEARKFTVPDGGKVPDDIRKNVETDARRFALEREAEQVPLAQAAAAYRRAAGFPGRHARDRMIERAAAAGDARALFEMWKADRSESAPAEEALTLLERKGQTLALVDLCRAIIDEDPRAAFAYRVLGHQLAQMRDGGRIEGGARLKEAAEGYARLVQAHPKDVSYRVDLAELQSRTGDHRDASRTLEPALALEPGNAAVRRKLIAEYQAAGNLAAQLAVLDCDDVDLLIDRARLLAKAGRKAEAEASYRKALARDPGSVPANGELGSLLDERGQREPAREHLERAATGAPADAWLARRLGRFAAERKDVPEMERVLARFRRTRPHDVDVEADFAQLFGDAGDHARAAALWTALLAGRPAPPHAQARLGGQLLEQGKVAEAVQALERVQPGQQRDAELHRLLADAYARSHQPALQARELEEALKTEPRDASSLIILAELEESTRGAEHVLPWLRTAVDAEPNADWSHAALAHALSGAHRYDEAAAELQRVLDIKPDNALARRERGEALEHAGKPAEALKEYEGALALLPDDPVMNVRRSELLVSRHRPRDAFDQWLALLGRKPSDQLAIGNLTSLSWQLDDSPGDLQRMERWAQAAPNESIPHELIGHRARLRKDLPRAEAEWRRALAIRADNPIARVGLADVLSDRGDLPGARTELETARRLDPHNALVLVPLGLLFVKIKNDSGAEECFREAARVDPRNVVARFQLGLSLEARAQHAEAEREFAAAVALHPELDWPHVGLAQFLDRRGRSADAQREWARAKQINPDVAVPPGH